jgi:hypothetical protein
VSSQESNDWDTEYRCIYVVNTHASLTLQNAKVWISSNTPSSSTEIQIGLGSSAINGTEQTPGSESTTPSGVTFSLAASGHTSVQKSGLFNASSSGTMTHENTFTAVTLATNDQLQVTWTLTLG